MKFLLLILLIIVTQRVAAIPIESIDAMSTYPLAPKGGVMMVQLVSEFNGDNWPSEMMVTFENGDLQRGVVGWIEKNPNTFHWTSNPFVIRPITQKDNTLLINPKDTTTGPVLLVELPEICEGNITFGGTVLSPQWIDLPFSMPSLGIRTTKATTQLHPMVKDSLPEWNPLEYWRWSIIASQNNEVVPLPPTSSEVARLAALHGLHVWRIGFDRLARSSRGVAAACRDLLTNTAFDTGHQFACWVVRFNSLNRLLSIMLDTSSSSRQLATRALRWSEEQHPYIRWLEQVYGENITVAIANPTLEPVVASIQWQEESDIPVAAEIPASKTLRTKVSRPPLVDHSLFGPVTPESQLQWLTVTLDAKSYTLPIVSPEVSVMPPSIQFNTLHPLWNLQSIQAGQPNNPMPHQKTTAHLRKMFGVWELLIHCYGISEPDSLSDAFLTVAQLRGIEAISILHPDTHTIVIITPHHQRLVEGMTVHRTLQENGWIVRVELPNSWVENETLSLAIARTHGDSQRVETGPLPCLPWNINPTPITLDLSKWDHITTFPHSR